MANVIRQWTGDLFRLFYPELCMACNKPLSRTAVSLCFRCEAELPYTGFIQNNNNALAMRFWGRVPLQKAAAFFHFKKQGPVQNLLHQLKYNSRLDVGEYIGHMMGREMIYTGDGWDTINAIIPLPLHWKKQRKRGYNQCAPLAEGIAKAMHIPVLHKAMERIHDNVSQTGKNRFERYENVAGIFSIKQPDTLKNKHILLVDDVVTTGSTAEACLTTLQQIEGVRLSFAAIAVAEK